MNRRRRVLCFDANTGKELWRRDRDEFAMRPEALPWSDPNAVPQCSPMPDHCLA